MKEYSSAYLTHLKLEEVAQFHKDSFSYLHEFLRNVLCVLRPIDCEII